MSDIYGGEDIDLEAETAAQESVEAEPVEAESVEAEPVQEPIGRDETIPLSAFNDTRAQLRRSQDEVNNLKTQVSQLMYLREELERQRTSQVEEQEFNSDPLGSIQKQVKSLQEQITTTHQSEQQAAQQQQQEQQFFQAIAAQVNEFRQTAPDYDDALNFVLNSRRDELLAMGVNENDANMRIGHEAQEISMNAFQSGQNPAQVVYQMAKLRGFNPPKATKNLENIKKGQQASSSLSGASGSADDSDVSLAGMDQWSDEEFDKFWSDMEKSAKPRH